MSVTTIAPLEILTDDETRRDFEEKTRAMLDMSADEFTAHLDAGDFIDRLDDPDDDVLYLAMLSRVVRY